MTPGSKGSAGLCSWRGRVLVLAGMLASGGALSGQTFSSSGSITVSSAVGAANPYPTVSNCANAACITVSGFSGSLNTITLTLTNLNMTGFNNVSIELISPGGIAYDLVSGTCNISGPVTITLSDNGASLIPGGGATACALTNNGTYKPTNYINPPADVFPAPGVNQTVANSPANTGTATFNSLYHGLAAANVNGIWKLAVFTEAAFAPVASGSIGSWSLTLTASALPGTATSLARTSGPNPSFTTSPNNLVTFTATVTSTSTVNGGTVTFTDNGSAIACQSGSNTTVSNGIATCIASFSAEGDHSVQATYGGNGSFASSPASNTVTQTVVNHSVQTGNTFCNPGAIQLPSPVAVPGASTPDPSQIFVSGLTGIIQNVTVSINNLAFTDYGTLGLMLAGPNGKNVELMSFASESFQGSRNTTGSPLNLVLDDAAANAIPLTSGLTSGTFRPASYAISFSGSPDNYPTGAPVFDLTAPSGTATLLSEFGGAGANGTWSLWISERGNPQSGSIGTGAASGSWCVNFTLLANAHPTTTTVTSSKNPAFTGAAPDSVTFTANVTVSDASGLTAPGGTVTFTDGANVLGTAAVTGGVATLVGVNNLTEGTHHIVASYGGFSGAANFGVSNGSVNQRIDRTIAAPSTNGNTFTYCNTGSIAVPASGQNLGQAGPYPSNILVSGLPGTVAGVTVNLNGFTSIFPNGVRSLLLAPNGGTLDFFSGVGGTNTVSNLNLVFNDAAGSVVSTSALSSGTFRPTSLGTTTNTYPACPVAAPDCASPAVGPPAPSTINFAAPAGAATFASGIGSGFAGNGDWSLFQQSTISNPSLASETGWCVNLTVNRPVLSLAKSGPTSVVQGQTGVPYTLTVTNNGPGPTGGTVSVTDTPGAGLTVTAMNGTNWTCTQPAGPCTRSDALAAGTSYEAVTVTVSVSGSATTGTGASSNFGSVSGGGASGSVNSNTVSINVFPPPALQVTKSHTGSFTAGSTGNWTIDVQNTAVGSTTSGTLTVADVLASGTTLSAFSGTGWFCSGTVTLSCTNAAAVAGGNHYPLLTLTVNIPSNATGSLSNSTTASGAGAASSANSNTDSVTVLVGPSITTQPQNQTVCAGNTATFTAAASGSPSPTVKWQSSPNGVTYTDISGATSATLSFTAAAGMDGTQYRAVFTNGTGTATTTAATLTVNTSPSVSLNPLSQTVQSGQTVTFTAAATGKPTPTVQWQVSTNGGGSYTDISGATSTTLSFAVSASQNGNLYRAVFTNSCTTANTTPATLTVTAGTVTVTVSANINGPVVSVDGGGPFTGSQMFTWNLGSIHTLSTTTPQAGGAGTQYAFVAWSDGGAISHAVTASAGTTTYTATFKSQFLVTTAASPAVGGSVSPSSGFFDANAVVPVSATPNNGWTFGGFAGSLTGTTNPQNLTVTGPAIVTANFTGLPAQMTALIESRSGPANARTWGLRLTNRGPATVTGPSLMGVALSQTAGAACTPVVVPLFPQTLVDLPPGASAVGTAVIDFTGCGVDAQFSVTISFVGSGGTVSGSRTLFFQPM